MSPDSTVPDPTVPGPTPLARRLPIPPEVDRPVTFTAEELREIQTNGVSLDEIIRVIEAVDRERSAAVAASKNTGSAKATS